MIENENENILFDEVDRKKEKFNEFLEQKKEEKLKLKHIDSLAERFDEENNKVLENIRKSMDKYKDE